MIASRKSAVLLVSIAGACSRSGKTALAVSVLKALAPAPGGVEAVKFTTTDDVFERCPRGTPCLVCDIEVPFRLVTDARTLAEPGTDTERLAAAGARRVLWAIAKRGAVGPAWQAVRARLADAASVVMEGSTIVSLARPGLLLFVVHPFLAKARWKAGSGALLRQADAVVVNLPSGERRDPAPEVLAAIARERGTDGVRVADVTRPLAEWAPDLAARLQAPAGARAAVS
jgi:hypothetical protein